MTQTPDHAAHLYDWMVGELVAVADELAASSRPGASPLYSGMVSQVVLAVADYISESRGSGTFDLVSELQARKRAASAQYSSQPCR